MLLSHPQPCPLPFARPPLHHASSDTPPRSIGQPSYPSFVPAAAGASTPVAASAGAHAAAAALSASRSTPVNYRRLSPAAPAAATSGPLLLPVSSASPGAAWPAGRYEQHAPELPGQTNRDEKDVCSRPGSGEKGGKGGGGGGGGGMGSLKSSTPVGLTTSQSTGTLASSHLGSFSPLPPKIGSYMSFHSSSAASSTSSSPAASLNRPSCSACAPFPCSSLCPVQHPGLSRFLASELGASVMCHRLRTGAIFAKHGSKGKPHYRLVWTSTDLKYIYWGELKSRRIRGSLSSDTLLAVSVGHSTRLLKERAGKDSDPDKCLSLTTTSRTLDLEAISTHERDLWKLTFDYLIVLKAKQRSAAIHAHTAQAGAAPPPVSVPSSPSLPPMSLVQALELLADGLPSDQELAEAEAEEAAASQPPQQQPAPVDASNCASPPHPNGSAPGSPRARTIEAAGGTVVRPFRQEENGVGQAPVQLLVTPPRTEERTSRGEQPTHSGRHEAEPSVDGKSVHTSPSRSAAPSEPSSPPYVTMDVSAYRTCLEHDIEYYRESNRALMIQHGRVCIELQERIDDLRRENIKLVKQTVPQKVTW